MPLTTKSGIRVAVVGAGPAGLTAAYVLSRAGVEAHVYEGSDSVGGLAKSIRLWGQTVDLGPHRFFSHDRRVNELWLEVVKRDYAMVQRSTRILYRGKLHKYPLQPFDALTKLGPLEAIRCLTSYGLEQLRPTHQNGTFENWACSRFGRCLFEIFFKTYSEKLWGIPCTELDADFAAQRIKQFSLSAAIKNAFFKTAEKHRTLADEFAYPNGGTGMVYKRMAESVSQRGGQVLLRTPVHRVLTEHNRIKGIELPDGTARNYDYVVSSMPLTQLVARLQEAPSAVIEASRQLTFRNTILVYLEIASSTVCEDNWMYIHSPELRTGRITNFRNWTTKLYGDSPNTILAMEYWCNEGDDLWQKCDDELISMARHELMATTLVESQSLVMKGIVHRIPKCYPVYRRGYKNLLQPIQAHLGEIRGLHVIGRYGSFKYNNQDHSILMGILAAENILENAGHDLWTVNADYDTYQEGWSITETGLVSSLGMKQNSGSASRGDEAVALTAPSCESR
ncbi:MAG TPA: FAD-dependent oxidoreductase [Verrucomicrobiae bacterium]|nr:FAD-dependent oxidoreductase [Verrucomicrobiae bacterium]